ncbi:MAG: hypothetical protein AAGA58_05820 [Verrucomicrobiota bacterium]
MTDTEENNPSFFTHLWNHKIKLALLAFLLLGVLIHRPALETIRTFRADRLQTAAEESAANENWREVERKALASLQLHPRHDTFRLYFRAARALRNPQLPQISLQLFASPEATPADRAEAIEVFLDINDAIAAANLLKTLPAEERKSEPMRTHFFRFLLGTGQFQPAIDLHAQVGEAERIPEYDLLLARTLIGQNDPKLVEIARERLVFVLESDATSEEDAHRALTIVATSPGDPVDHQLAQITLKRFPDPEVIPFPQRLHLHTLRIRTEPESKPTVTEEVLASGPASFPYETARWLQTHREWDAVLEVTADEATSDPRDVQFFSTRLEALFAMGKFEQVEQELTTAPPGLPNSELHALKATVATLQKDPVAATRHWSKAMESARSQPSRNEFYKIARLANQVGATDLKMKALASGIEHPRGNPPLARELGPLFVWLAENDMTRLERISGRLLRREPGNPMLLNNYHYIKVLLEEEVPEPSLKTLENLVSQFPDTIPFRGSLAMAYLRLGKNQEAVTTLNPTGTESIELPPTEKVLYKVAKAKSADTTPIIPAELSLLSPPEKDIVKRLLVDSN